MAATPVARTANRATRENCILLIVVKVGLLKREKDWQEERRVRSKCKRRTKKEEKGTAERKRNAKL
jgi:hypothetical protein